MNEGDVRRIAQWSPEMTPAEIPFSPSRVILQDFTGVPALVDIAALRITTELGRSKQSKPTSSVDLVVDHSVQADAPGLFLTLEREI